MKWTLAIPALILAMAHIGSAQAQSAAAVVSSSTADATTRVVTEAVKGATTEALKSDQKTEAMTSDKMKPSAKKAENAMKAGKK
jgi:hypothetical protein